LHSAVADFLRVALPRDAVFFTIPNGDGKMTTAPGALSGVPDLQIVYRGRPIFIELKTKTGRLSDAQRDVHMRLAAAGAVVAVCRSVVEVEEFLAMLIPLRARVAA
jgi:hypothetical protein